jgi:hypothetical protein
MPDFLRSQLKLLTMRPWRYTTQPTYDGPKMLTEGVMQTPSGVFILLSDAVVEKAKATLTAAQKTEIAGWLYKVSNETPLPAGYEDAGLWHIPMWAGETRATLLRIPANIWNDPTTVPPLKVRQFLKDFYL